MTDAMRVSLLIQKDNSLNCEINNLTLLANIISIISIL
jgi:hypothetical protein